MEWGGKYLLAYLRDDVGRKSWESVHGIVLYVRSEKLYALRKSYLSQLTCDPADWGKVIVNLSFEYWCQFCQSAVSDLSRARIVWRF